MSHPHGPPDIPALFDRNCLHSSGVSLIVRATAALADKVSAGMADEVDLEQILDMAVARHEAGQSDLAEAGYRTILQCDPNEPDALNLLGVILQERGEFDEAIALIARALEIEPNFPEALTNLARAQRAVGAPAVAVDAARRAVV